MKSSVILFLIIIFVSSISFAHHIFQGDRELLLQRYPQIDQFAEQYPELLPQLTYGVLHHAMQYPANSSQRRVGMRVLEYVALTRDRR